MDNVQQNVPKMNQPLSQTCKESKKKKIQIPNLNMAFISLISYIFTPHACNTCTFLNIQAGLPNFIFQNAYAIFEKRWWQGKLNKFLAIKHRIQVTITKFTTAYNSEPF
jgi:hypothetical protein